LATNSPFSTSLPALSVQLNVDGTTRESASVNNDCDLQVRVDRWTDKAGKLVEKGLFVAKARNGRKDFRLDLHLNGPRYRFEDHSTTIPK